MMDMVEHDMFRKMNYILNMPTCLDVMLQLLYLEDEGELASEEKSIYIQNLVGKTLPIMMLCIKEYDIVHQHT
jgi:hypothetical protein